MTIVTREYMQARIERNGPDLAQFIGRALVHLLRRQTQAEQEANTTSNYNERGFTPADAFTGCISAKYFLKHGTLLDWQIKKWTKPNAKGVARISKYWRQLDEEAKAKRAA
jgi:hypothetical protein